MMMISLWMSGRRAILARAALCLAFALAAGGCGREEVRVFNEPKDEASGMAQALPAGWQEIAPEPVSLKSYRVSDTSGGSATISITRLGNLTGMDATLVNMWRGQAGLEPLKDEDAAKSIETVNFGGGKGSYFEVLGSGTNGAVRILTAFSHRADGSWFCKLSGTPALVAAQKPAFIEFLKTIKLEAPTEPAATPVATAPTQYHWNVPAGWTEVPAGEMQTARFTITRGAGAKADVFVSVFDNDTGGTVANITRWRRQVGLEPVGEEEMSKLVTPLDAAVPGAVLVDMKKDNQQLIGAIVTRGGKYWFYKLQGDAAIVAAEKDAFIGFAKSNP